MSGEADGNAKTKKRKFDEMAISNSQKKSQRNELYIAKLPLSFKVKDIQQMCAPFGTVKETFLMREPNGKSRCASFVQMASKEECLAVIEILNGQTLPVADSRGPLLVKFSRDGEIKKTLAVRETNLYFCGLPMQFAERDLTEMLSSDGCVMSVRILRNQNGVSFGKALALMSSHDECEAIIEKYNNTVLPGCAMNLVVKYANNETKQTPRQITAGAGDLADKLAKNCKLYVYGLPLSMTATELTRLFTLSGDVIHLNVLFYHNGLNEHAAIVQMGSRTQCKLAISMYNNFHLPNSRSPWKVIFADKVDISKSEPKDDADQAQLPKGHLKLYVAGIPLYVQNADLKQMFASCGNVVAAEVRPVANNGRCIGFVEMSSDAECQQAIDTFNGANLPDLSGELTVRKAYTKAKAKPNECSQKITDTPSVSKDNSEHGLMTNTSKRRTKSVIPLSDGHIVGLQYVTEFQNKENAVYICRLCDIGSMGPNRVIGHVRSIRHQGLYLMRHHPKMVEELRAVQPMPNDLRWSLNSFIKKAQVMDGRGVMVTNYTPDCNVHDLAANAFPARKKQISRRAFLLELLAYAEDDMPREFREILDSLPAYSANDDDRRTMQGHLKPGRQDHAKSQGQGRIWGGQGHQMLGGQSNALSGGEDRQMLGGQGRQMAGQGHATFRGQVHQMSGGQVLQVPGQVHQLSESQTHQISGGQVHTMTDQHHAMLGQGQQILGGRGHTISGRQGHIMPAQSSARSGQGHPMSGEGGNSGFTRPANTNIDILGSSSGISTGILVNNEEEAEAALQVSSQIAQALIKYRMKQKKTENQQREAGSTSHNAAKGNGTAPAGMPTANWTNATAASAGGPAGNWAPNGRPTNWAPGGRPATNLAPSGGPVTNWAPGSGPATNWALGGGPAKNWAPGGGPATNLATGGIPATNWAPAGGPATNWAPGGRPATNWTPGCGPATNWAPGGGPAANLASAGDPATNWVPQRGGPPTTWTPGGGPAINWTPGGSPAANWAPGGGPATNWTPGGGPATNWAPSVR